jgi:hypothetical protein
MLIMTETDTATAIVVTLLVEPEELAGGLDVPVENGPKPPMVTVRTATAPEMTASRIVVLAPLYTMLAPSGNPLSRTSYRIKSAATRPSGARHSTRKALAMASWNNIGGCVIATAMGGIRNTKAAEVGPTPTDVHACTLML